MIRVAEERKPNWVDRRAHRESLLKGADSVWNQVRAAIEDACESFNKHYPAQAPVQCEQENENRLYITRTVPDDRDLTFGATRVRVLVITFTSPKITAVYEDRSSTYTITADDESAFVIDRRAARSLSERLHQRQPERSDGDGRMSPDDVSEAMLKSILFPMPDETRPRSREPGDGNADL
jgi:hypothetical protein